MSVGEGISPGHGITGGEVHYLQRVKTGDYEHKEAGVRINFTVPDGYDHRPILDRAADEAVNKSKIILGLIASERRTLGRPPKLSRQVAQDAVSVTLEDTNPLRSSDPTDMGDTDDLKSPRAEVKASDPALAAGREALGVDAMEDPSIGGEQPTSSSAPASTNSSTGPSVDDVNPDDWSAEVPEITDKQLSEACNRCAQEKKNPQAIRTLIGKYVAPPGQVRQIPKDQRQRFLDDLANVPDKSK